MGLIDKAGELVGTAAGRVGSALSDLPDLPGVDIERLRVVIEVVWENRDFLVKLPSVLGDAGEQMQAAGVGAREVGSFMSGEVHDLTIQAAETLEACRKPLAQVGEVLDELGAVLDRLPLVGNVAEPATRGLGAITEVAINIERVSVQLRGLSVSMQGAGAGLDAMGASLQGGGMALATVSGRTISQAAAARRQAAAEAKPRRRATDPPPHGHEAIDFTDEAPVDTAGTDVLDGRPQASSTAAKKATAQKSTASKKRVGKTTSTTKATAAKKPPAKKQAAKKPAAKKPAGKKRAPSKKAKPNTAD